ncbi:LpqB family beta-propeller domain-containing protein [Microbacterium sp. SSM24]|uniref:LpqB family beta-propeller domain-containing protein n=1 Tax=Microbacterium sp. SSM24 TaxID=2991714 RepID=UPI002226EF85|nr:LpqB family beta-propeller domain-containing protein [Microbacterium sp. SSM24]MCW3493789.1 LpqB family beta-propeller domain-containing protein [Microbacterium sp. SSM24]
MTARRGILSLVVAVLAIALTACSGLPTSGKVNYGLSTSDAPDPEEISFLLPDRPQPGATPEQIVEGFIRAGSGPGVGTNWDRAREFLTPQFSKVWNPSAGVIVDVFEERDLGETDEGAVSMSITAVATVDGTGTYERAEVGERVLPFELQQVDGEWRISFADDGVVLDRDEFPRVFHDYSVMYFDPTWQYLVPDTRWYPTTGAPRLVVDALIAPPSAWLGEAVESAFPEGVTVIAAVRRPGNVYEVDLSESVLGADPETIDRMYTQLRASLATAGMTDVELTVQSTPIDADVVAVRSTRIPGAPLVLTEDGFGFLAGGEEIEPIPRLSEMVEEFAPVAIQVDPQREAAAIRQADGTVSIVRANETWDTLDPRPGLIDPSIDPFDIVWTVPRDQPGGLQAYLRDLTPVVVADAWPGATAVHAMSVSRDGTRIAAVVTAGGRTALWVAGIVRGADQVPERLGDPLQLAVVDGASRGIAWLDDLSIGVLSGDAEGTEVLEQVVGGLTSTSSAPETMSSIAGGTSLSSVRLLADDGTLSVKRGTTWQPTATGVRVLATQQGMPE